MPHIFIFGYGSLMDEESLQKTISGKTIVCQAILKGWRRKFDKIGREGTYSYLNLVRTKSENQIQQVEGVLIKVDPAELELLKKREKGYGVVDVTNQILILPEDAVVFAFIALPPEKFHEKLPVRRSYLKKCLAGLSPKEQKRWLQETDLDGAKIDENG